MILKSVVIRRGQILPSDTDVNEFTCNVGDLDLFPGLGRSSGEGNDYPFQYSCLENFMDRGACRATVHGVAKSQLNNFHFQVIELTLNPLD